MSAATRNRRARTGAPQMQRDEESDERGGEEDKGLSETKGKNPKKVTSKYICRGGDKVCGQVIADEEKSVECDLCNEWFHAGCQGLSAEAWGALSEFGFIWLCLRCKPSLKNILKTGKKLETQIETVQHKILEALEATVPKSERDNSKQLQDKIASMEEVVTGKLVEQQKEVEKTLNAQKEMVQSMPKIQSELQKNTQELKRMIEKNEDREKREVNVIVHNIPESRSSEATLRKRYDENSFQNMVEALLGENVTMEIGKIYRIGKKKEVAEGHEGEPKPRLMLVGLKRKEDVDVLMKERWNLKKVGFSNIYITRDLSPEQREEQKRLRDELVSKGKDTHRIFRGKVVPRK